MLDHFKLQVLTIDSDKSHLTQVQELIEAGAKWIQYRNKSQYYLEYRDELKEVSQLCKDAGVTLIVNDSIDALQYSKAAGIHVGQKDLSPQVLRNVLGPKKIIGVTVNSLADAQKVVREGVANYVGLGPFSPTQTKENLAPLLSADEIQECLQVLEGIPVVLIGGIQQDNLEKAQSMGCQGLAISSAISAQSDIQASYRQFAELLEVGV